jgi:hypothetical protein
MKRITCDNVELGMRVRLTHPDPSYDIGLSNPRIGTKYECLGVVTETGYESIHVKWDNGHGNTYKDDELSLVNSGRFVDIWEEM